MKGLNEMQLEMALANIRRLKKEHPKATVLLDPETNQIEIKYPLPKDFLEIGKLEIKDL